MKLFSKSFLIIASIILFLGIGQLSAQKATAEFINHINPPAISDTIPIRDGERYVTYQDNYFFLVNFWSGVQIVDISDVHSPKQLAFLQTGDMVRNVKYAENKLFIADEAEGVLVYDLTNMSAPQLLAKIKTPGDAYWVDVQMPYIFVALGHEGFCIMDISDLSDPRTVSLELPDGWVWSLNAAADKLYVNAKQAGFYTYDLTDITAIKKLSQLKSDFQAINANIEGNYAYVANGPGGLSVIDISNPALPQQVGTFKTRGFSSGVSKFGSYIYLTNQENGLFILNVEDPANPVLEGTYTPQSKSYAVIKKGVYVYLTTDTKTEILRHNNQPILSDVTNQFIPENQPFTLQLEAMDKDGDSLVYHLANLPEGAVFGETTGLLSWTPSYEQSGMYKQLIFTVTEITESKLTVSDTIDISVKHVNRLPDLPDIENQTVDENVMLTINAQEATDPDKEDIGKITYRLENAPQGATFDPETRAFNWQPTYDQSGSYIVDFVADDGSMGIDRESITITVNHINRPPSITQMADATGDENKEILLQVAGNEPDKEDQNIVQYSMLNLPEGAIFDPATAQFKWTPTYDQSGNYENIQAIITAGVFADTTTFAITVNHVNRVPVLAEVAAQTINENEALQFNISGSDADVEDTGKLVFAAVNLPEGASFDPATLQFNWMPTFEQSGEYSTLQFTVTDPSGLADTKAVSVTVVHINRPPVLEAVSEQITDENNLLTIQLVGSDPDKEDITKLVYSCDALPQGATLDAATGAFSWTPGFDQSGEYPLTFSISDGILSSSQATKITVNHVNRAPVLAATQLASYPENQQMSFDISGSDPDTEDAGKLVYQMTGLPEGAAFDAAGKTFSWLPNFDHAGDYTLTISVSDPAGLTDSKPVVLKIENINRSPAVEKPADVTADENSAVSFQLVGSDPDKEDAGNLKYSAENLPEGATLDAAAGAFNWTPNYAQAGEFIVKFSVTDVAGEMAKTEAKFIVNNVNRAPQLNTMSTQTVQAGSEVSFTLSASDPDSDDELKFSSGNLPDGAKLNDNSGAFNWKPSDEQSGSHSVQFTVTDKAGDSAQITVEITVKTPPPPPPAPQD